MTLDDLEIAKKLDPKVSLGVDGPHFMALKCQGRKKNASRKTCVFLLVKAH